MPTIPLCLSLVSVASAADPAKDAKAPDAPSVKVSGVLFPRFSYDLSDGAEGYNEFALDRSYLVATAKMSDVFGVRLTLDANRLKPVEVAPDTEVVVDTRYRVFVKHAWLEMRASASRARIRRAGESRGARPAPPTKDPQEHPQPTGRRSPP